MATFIKNIPTWVYIVLSYPIGWCILSLLHDTFPDRNLLITVVGITLVDVALYGIIKLLRFLFKK